MSDSFTELFEESLKQTKMRSGDIVKGKIVGVDNKFVLIDVGLKSEGVVPIEQFTNATGELEANIGDEVDVVVEMPTDDFGETRLSREKAKRAQTWIKLVEAHENDKVVEGLVSGKVKGGFTVEIEGVRAFLPGSLLDTRPLNDSGNFEGEVLAFKIIKVDEKRNNIVVSRRAVIEQENSAERFKLLENLEEGQVIKGIVKNITDYGVFIDLGGVDGLLHITDIAWKRVKHPSEVLKLGEEIEVMILKFDKEKSRVSLGLKQLNKDPWSEIVDRYAVGTKLTGKITNLTDYGCFVELEEGVEGLVHMSEMDWTNKNIHPSKVVQPGNEVEVVVLELDPERRRISLGMKQCVDNPWAAFAEKYQKDEHIKGSIRSITDFGIFIGLEGGIDGLVHLSDISWDEPGEQAIRNYKKGNEVEAVILSVDAERERISLGIKQLQHDPFTSYADKHPKGTVVKGKVTEIGEKQAMLELAEEVIGRIKVAEVAAEKVNNINDYLKVGDEVKAKIISVNHKDRMISLSIKALQVAEVEERKKKAESDMIKPTLGDLIKEKIASAVGIKADEKPAEEKKTKKTKKKDSEIVEAAATENVKEEPPKNVEEVAEENKE